MTTRWKSLAVLVTVLATFATALPASAKPAPVTKIKFKLDTHEVAAGESLTGSVHVWSRAGNTWALFPKATLRLFVDGTEIFPALTTGVDGSAAVAYTAADEGDHVMKVVFEAIEGHKKAQRAQGFSVSAEATVAAIPTVPEAPVLTATPGTGVVSLSWTVPADGGSAILSYTVFRVDSTGTQTMNASITGGTSTTFDDISATPGTVWTYTVAAVNAVGPGPWSNAVTLTAI